MSGTLTTEVGIERRVGTVSEGRAFEILVADCLRLEPFPREIKVTGEAMGWADRIKAMAARRGWGIEISIREGAQKGKKL